MTVEESENLTTVFELSQLMGYSKEKIIELCKQGLIPFHEIENEYMFNLKELEGYLNIAKI